MANLSQFAKSMRDLGETIEFNADKAVRETAALISQVVIIATPVDTGRARANWIVGLGGPQLEPHDTTDPSGRATIGSNDAKIATQRRGQDIYISNNLPYIVPLNDGHSAQAPAGFVEQAVSTANNALRQKRLLKRSR